MRLEVTKYLFDVKSAAARIAEFTTGKHFDDYAREAMLRSAVERQVEIISEAPAQLARLDQQLVTRITEYRHIIAFRNILIRGYADVDDRIVWGIVEVKLPVLRHEIEGLLGEG